ncbi:MAG: hypothetical protein EB036_14030 [Betaproteobacteria bacterium]|jgi:hypothetical protein|nr:hypothetical protein [Betaproteobacteria bacterium]NCX23259.1 hypothetical protein [Betaproteobacteria bacterium]NCX89723.1 hypothetical protein [Betaproteobacteria bacterium]NCZ48361.1 hypothetical protein [Betaproteobacteria bacterium]NDA33085.1 hypothetical protein [Betaproteobacteria bacterium]
MEQQMASLQQLKLISAKRQQSVDPTQFRRFKLAGRLEDQIALAQAMLEQRTYTKERVRSVRDASGMRTSVQVHTRVKPWWWVMENGKLALSIRYGSRVIALSPKSNAIECASLNDVVQALATVKAVVEAGELDAAITAVSEKVRAGFKA